MLWPDGRAGGKRYAHAVSYEMHVGPIPEGHQIDHLCHNGSGCLGVAECRHRRCVNPAHLEAVVGSVNILRSRGWVEDSDGIWTCKNGHVDMMGVKNPSRTIGPVNYCRGCSRDEKRRRRDRCRELGIPFN